jgi:hypothetical protein
MEQIHIREKNNINTKIKSLNVFIERNKATISRLLAQNKVSEFDKKQVETRKEANIKYLKEIEDLNDRLDKLSKGLLDSEFKAEKCILQEKVDRENDKVAKKTKDKNDKKIAEKVFIDKSYSLNSKDNSAKYLENDYKKFCRLSNKVPSYILRNLKEMPSNKGYIITDKNNNDIWCFGELEAEKNKPIIMFKKLKDDILQIHEIDSKYISIFEKKGRDSKVLKSKQLRKEIF